MLAGHDVVFLALPHGHSAALAAQLPDAVVVIDCGADFRLEPRRPGPTFYDTAYAGSWPYGLPELPLAGGVRQRERARGREPHRRARAATRRPSRLALAPGFAAGLLEAEDVVVVAASGTSGAGKSLKPHLLGAR